LADNEAQVVFEKVNGNSEHIISNSNDDKSVYELTIPSFQVEDVGQYRCYARNENEYAQDVLDISSEEDGSFSIRLAAQEAQDDSTVVISKTLGSLEPGNSVELSCDLKGNIFFFPFLST
jgi:hypothetical protein